MPWIVMRQRDVLSAIDVGLRDWHLDGIRPKRDLVPQGLDGMRVQDVECASCRLDVGVIDKRLTPDLKRQDNGFVAPFNRNRLEKLDILRWQHVAEAFAVVWHEGVPIYEAPDTAWNSIGDAGDDHAAIAMADKDKIHKVVHIQILND